MWHGRRGLAAPALPNSQQPGPPLLRPAALGWAAPPLPPVLHPLPLCCPQGALFARVGKPRCTPSCCSSPCSSLPPSCSSRCSPAAPTRQRRLTRVGKHAQVVHGACGARCHKVGQAVVRLVAVLLRLLPQAVEAGGHLRWWWWLGVGGDVDVRRAGGR